MSNNREYFPTYLIVRELKSEDSMWDEYLIWGYRISMQETIFKADIIKYPQDLEQLICDILTKLINDGVNRFRQEDSDTPMTMRFYMGDDWGRKENPCVKTTMKLQTAREKGLFVKPNGKGKLTDALCKLADWELSPGNSSSSCSTSLNSYMQSFEGQIIREIRLADLSNYEELLEYRKKIKEEAQQFDNLEL